MAVDKTILQKVNEALSLAESLSDSFEMLSDELQDYDEVKLMSEELCNCIARIRADFE